MIYAAYALSMLYFATSKRRVDFYSLAAFSCAIYFLPSLFGYVWYTVPNPDGRYHDLILDVDPRVQLVHSAVILSVLGSAFIYDYFFIRAGFREASEKYEIETNNTLDRIVIFLSFATFALFLAQSLDAVLEGDKDKFGRTYALAAIAVPFAFSLSVLAGRHMVAALLGGCILLDLYAGNRETLVFSIVTISMVLLAGLGPLRLIRYYGYLVSAALLVILVMAYKNVAFAIQSGNWALVASRLTEPGYYFSSIARSEPFVTQAILHHAITMDWSYDGSFLAAIAPSLVPFGDLVFGRVETAASYINSSLFEDVGYGLASNVWAEAYVYGGWSAILAYLTIYSTLPAVLNRALVRCNSIRSATLLFLIGVILLFYIHRIGLEAAVNLVKRLLVFYLICASASFLLNRLPLPRKAAH